MPAIRPAAAADLPAIRDLQIASWQRAYRGILPDAFLAAEVPALLAGRWAALPGPHWIVGTAWRDGALAGFVSVDRDRTGGAYVDNLHVAAAAQGRGVGRALMAAAAGQLAREGHRRLWLTVVRENAQARGFYRRLGGREGPVAEELLYGQPVAAIPVMWRDLGLLARSRAAA